MVVEWQRPWIGGLQGDQGSNLDTNNGNSVIC